MLRAEVVSTPDDADYIIKEQFGFIPEIPADFVELTEKLHSKNSKERLPNFVDLNKPSSLQRFFLRLTETVENKKSKASIIAHVRCVPSEFDVVISLKDFINIR